MREILVALCAILAVTSAMVIIEDEGQNTPHLLGMKACTWGPSYWCTNITTSAGCQKTVHCIKHVWEKMNVPEDTDSVCSICKDMVQQARDQLESNQTQEDLKAVFEGSCALIHVKPIVKECDKLVDQFVPDLVETLASQMNPSVVCSVAGLCNSEHIDQLLLEHEKEPERLVTEISMKNDEHEPDECHKCFTIATFMEKKFEHASRDVVLEHMLSFCGKLGSLSDACSSTILVHFEPIYTHLKDNFKAQHICHLSGQCSQRFHVHEDSKTPEVEIRPLSSVGMVEVSDDLPCKLCEQLVTHLRDLLVANTTETEFEMVLKGFCKQMKSFSTECTAIVDEYYPQIYMYLTHGLNGNAICQMAEICPRPGAKTNGPVWPLIPEEHAKIAVKIMGEEKHELNKASEADEMQLPFDQIYTPLMSLNMGDPKQCALCGFVMDRLKQDIRDLSDRNEVESVLREIKETIPDSISKDDANERFMNIYFNAFLELVVQGKDLSTICRLVAVCPSDEEFGVWQSLPGTTALTDKRDKPSCALCLFAVTQLYEVIKENKTEASIEAALDKLCSHLSKSLNEQCIDLVKGYSKELISMIITDMSPQEICSFLKLCDATEEEEEVAVTPKSPVAVKVDADFKGQQSCAFCEYLLHYLQKAITYPAIESDIENILGKVCKKLPSSIDQQCIEFIDSYSSVLVSILAQEFDPSQICPMIHVCPSAQLMQITSQVVEKPNCPLCLLGMEELYKMVKDNKTEASIQRALDNLCVRLPKTLVPQCEKLVDDYSKRIIEMILADLTPQEVCVYLKLCDSKKSIDFSSSFPLDKDGEILTNEIPDFPLYPSETEVTADDTECTICQTFMQYMEKTLGNDKTKAAIEHAIHGACNHLPQHMASKCNNLVNEYADVILDLLTQDVSPREICVIIGLCKTQAPEMKKSVIECAMCQTIISTTENLLDDRDVQKDIEDAVSKVCKYLPANRQGTCTMMIEVYEQSIINLFKSHTNSRKFCTKMGLCSASDYLVMSVNNIRVRRSPAIHELKKCTWGEDFVCSNEAIATICNVVKQCLHKGYLADSSVSKQSEEEV